MGVVFVSTVFIGYTRFNAGADHTAIDLVPRDAGLYAHVFLKPSTKQRRALQALLERFPEIDTSEEAEGLLKQILDAPLGDLGLDYDDVRSWAGSELGFFARPGEGATLLMETKDKDKTTEAVAEARRRTGDPPSKKRAYKNVEYGLSAGGDAAGFVKDFLVAGPEQAFKAVVDASNGKSLASTPRYERAVRSVPTDRILLAYLDPDAYEPSAGFVRALDLTGVALSLKAPLTSVGYARADGVTLELAGESSQDGADPPDPSGGGPRGVAALPGTSWMSASLEGFPLALGSLLQGPQSSGSLPSAFEAFASELELDVDLSVLDSLTAPSFFVQGENLLSLTGAVTLSTSKPRATQQALRRIKEKVQTEQPETVFDLDIEGAEGFAYQQLAMPQKLLVALEGDKLVLGYGKDATEKGLGDGETLNDTAHFKEASETLGRGFAPFFYVDADAADRFAYSLAAFEPDFDYDNDVAPWTKPLEHVIAGSSRGDGRLTYRFLVLAGD